MKFNYSFRVKLGIGLIVLGALVSVVHLISLELIFYRDITSKHGTLTQYEKRFSEIRKVLESCDVVGYISDKEFKLNVYVSDDARELDQESMMEYSLTQYALSPVIIENNTEHLLVVGNFHDAVPDSYSYAERKLVLLKDFGGGVMLFKKVDR